MAHQMAHVQQLKGPQPAADLYAEHPCIHIVIPQPVSNNRLHTTSRRGGGRKILTPEGRRFYDHVRNGCLQLGISTLRLTGNLRIVMHAYPSSGMFDTENFCKCALDSLEKGGVVANDRSFRSVEITHIAVDKARPRLECWIYEKGRKSSK